MKKYLIASIVALTVALVGVSVSASFDRNMSVGSTGADVTALQNTLIAKGYSIPAGATGYFGQQTLAAVKLFQAANSVPNTGFVGLLTRGVLNGSPAVSTAMTLPFPCPAGYTAPAGWVCPGTAPTGPVVMTGTDGSVSVSQSSYVSTGIQVKKGETKDVVAVRLQATAGPVNLTRFDVHFSVRPWLFFNQVTLHDSNGKVVATKNLLSAADATEITVNSDYLVRFDGINYTVTPGTNPDLAVSVSVLPATDKITTGLVVTAAVTSGSIRTVNGMGFTDSIGGAALSGSTLPTTGAGANTFSFGSASANQADIYTRISPNSNPIEHSQAISLTQTTPSVSLGTYSLKSQNQSGTLNSVSFTIQTNPYIGGAISTLFSNIRLQDGSQTYGGTIDTVDSSKVNFTNLTIGLTQDQWKDLTIVADVAATSSTVRASSTLDKSTINGTDVNYNSLGVDNASNQTASNVILTTNSLTASGMSAAIFPGIADVANGPVQRYPVTYTFTLTNTSSNTLYVPADVSSLLGTSTNGNASSTIYLIEPVAAANGDTTTAYAISAGGGSRTFTVDGVIKKSSNTSSGEYMRITSIKYSASSALSNLQTINSGLEALYKAATF